MGIFNNETEEEKNLKKLVRAIRNSNLSEEWREYLADYVNRIYYGEIQNDFYTFDYLNRAILKICETENINSNPKSEFREILATMKQIMPEGNKGEDFDAKMEMFITNFLGDDGLLSKELFNPGFYYMFENRYDFLYIMNIIKNDDWLEDQFTAITDYALAVCPYCANQDILKREIVSFISGLGDEYGEVREYHERKLGEAKKRGGVYPFDESMLASVTSAAEKAQALLAKLDNFKKRADAYQDRISALTKSGKADITATINSAMKDLNGTKDSALSEMHTLLEESKADVIKKLDEYILVLEDQLKKSSDTIFNAILSDTTKKLREIRLAANGLSQSATSELIRIQNATEESVGKLRDYVDNDEKLQELLKGADDDDKIKSALLRLHASGLVDAPTNEANQTEGANPSIIVPGNAGIIDSGSPNIIIPGYDRIVSPANPSVVIPNGAVSRSVIPAFDENIPFEERMNRILKIKEERQANGEIFHDLTDEIIRCILEGDWLYLWGPSGCGKSYSIKQVAKLIGIDMLDNGKITDKYSIMAYNDPQGRFRATQAFVALVYGKLLSLDEFDNGNPDTQVVLNELYSGLLDTLEKPDELRYVTFAEDMRVPIHPNFRMISAGNTSGEGENQAFSSRGKIDESVQQRMTPKRFWSDNRVEERIFGEYTAWYNLFVKFRKICDDYAKMQGLDAPIGVVTTRDASAIVKYINHNSKSVEQIMDEKFVQTKSQDYTKFIMKKIRDMYDISSTEVRSKRAPLSEVKEVDLAKKLIKRCEFAHKQ